MNKRERRLLRVVLTLAGFFFSITGFFGLRGLVNSLNNKDTEIEKLLQEVSTNETRLLVLTQAQQKVEQWKGISLPPDLDTAKTRYKAFLQDLCRRNQFRVRQIRESGVLRAATTTRGGSSYSSVAYQVQVEGTLSRLISFLSDFYAVNLPQMIREITITSQGSSDGPLDIAFKVEALSFPTAHNRDSLVPLPDARVMALESITALQLGPAGLPSALWLITPTGHHGGKKLAASIHRTREYSRMVTKNIFTGLKPPPPPPIIPVATAPKADADVLKFVQLSSITSNFVKTEASLRNKMTNGKIRLRHDDTFEVKDASGQVVLKGKVKAIDQRHVEVVVGKKAYRLSMGGNLYDVIRPDKLSKEELQDFIKNPKSEKSP